MQVTVITKLILIVLTDPSGLKKIKILMTFFLSRIPF